MTPEQQKHLLPFIATNDLQTELLKRFDHAIFSGLVDRPTDDSPMNQLTSWRYHGNPFICQGLASGIIAECQDQRQREERPVDSSEL